MADTGTSGSQQKEPCKTLLHPAATGSKADCVQHMEGGSVTRFNPKHDYPQGCTDYERWKHAKVDSAVSN